MREGRTWDVSLMLTPSPHIYRQGKRASPLHSCAPHAPPGLVVCFGRCLRWWRRKQGKNKTIGARTRAEPVTWCLNSCEKGKTGRASRDPCNRRPAGHSHAATRPDQGGSCVHPAQRREACHVARSGADPRASACLPGRPTGACRVAWQGRPRAHALHHDAGSGQWPTATWRSQVGSRTYGYGGSDVGPADVIYFVFSLFSSSRLLCMQIIYPFRLSR
jgi:hypothetical protein